MIKLTLVAGLMTYPRWLFSTLLVTLFHTVEVRRNVFRFRFP